MQLGKTYSVRFDICGNIINIYQYHKALTLLPDKRYADYISIIL